MSRIFLFPGLMLAGFFIGLSGAMIPGPILAFTIKESISGGAKTGLLVMAGHFVVEATTVLLLLFGFIRFLTSPVFIGVAGITGALVLFVMGIALLKQTKLEGGGSAEKAYSPVFGGIALTILNPTFPLWWATVGYSMLLDGIRLGGNTGVGFMLFGHWLSDFGWYSLVSASVAGGRDMIVREKVYPKLKAAMAVFMFLLGLYFLSKGIKSII